MLFSIISEKKKKEKKDKKKREKDVSLIENDSSAESNAPADEITGDYAGIKVKALPARLTILDEQEDQCINPKKSNQNLESPPAQVGYFN